MRKKHPNANIHAYKKAGTVEYTMSAQCARTLLESRKDAEKDIPPQDYLVNYVNNTYGLLRNCERVILT